MMGLWVGLATAAALIVLVVWLGLPAARRGISSVEAGGFAGQGRPLNPLSWIEVLPDDRIRLYVPKAEMGQGTHTGLAQIAAEELEVPLDRLEVVHASTHQAENKYRGTYGSMSISSLYRPMRRAAATMREMLRSEAAASLGVAAEMLVVREGRFELPGDPGCSMTYSEIAQRNPKWRVPRAPMALKRPEQFRLIGRSLPRVDAPAKVAGRAIYGQDAHAEGMLHGAVVLPPTIETRMLSAKPGRAASMPGVVKVVIEKGFAGVVARSRIQAQAALAVPEGRGVRVWTSTQVETMVARRVARALGIKTRQVEVIPTFLGGGFGGKEGGNRIPSTAIDAARLALASGAPVHVGWDREEEFRHGYARPMTHHKLSAKLNGSRIEAVRWQEASGDSILGLVPGLVGRILGFDPGATRGARLQYEISHREVTAWRRPMPLQTGQWRGLGLAANIFALESFIDEAAHAAGTDPLQFRLDHLGADAESRRMAAVLKAAAERAGWGGPAPADCGRGIACCFYHGTVVAEVAEISVDEPTGRIRLHRVVAALDCGHAVNPDQVRAQAEGCIVMGASVALLEELTVEDGKVAAGSFADYQIFTAIETPEIETIILETPGRDPSGAGEPPIGPIAPAIGNALFALTGVRMRRLPMTQERVRIALRETGSIGP